MRTCVALTLLLIFPDLSGARIATAWTYESMYQQSDLVVIAKPVSVAESGEVESLPNLNPKTNVYVVKTAFSTSVVLKGQSPNGFQLRHYKLVNPFQSAVAGPSFVWFDPAQRHSYLMFLKSDQAGSFSPVTGQADATVAVIKLEGSAQ
jgi:hypothetical protein